MAVLAALIISVPVFFTVRTALLKSYGLMAVGRYETHPTLYSFALSHVLYNVSADDAVYVPDEMISDILESDYGYEMPDITLKELFLLMYDKIEDMKLGRRYETGGFFERCDYMDSCNDPLKFEVIEATYIEKIKSYVPDYAYLDFIENDLSKSLIKSLLPQVFGDWLNMYIRHVFYGVILCIGIVRVPLVWAFVLLYALALVLLVIAFKKKHMPGVYSMLLTLLIIAGLSSSVSLIHFCISRYMFYAFPIFYSSLAYLIITLAPSGGLLRKAPVDNGKNT